jgi:hypothetical protein
MGKNYYLNRRNIYVTWVLTEEAIKTVTPFILVKRDKLRGIMSEKTVVYFSSKEVFSVNITKTGFSRKGNGIFSSYMETWAFNKGILLTVCAIEVEFGKSC